jgi:hypothetical protein
MRSSPWAAEPQLHGRRRGRRLVQALTVPWLRQVQGHVASLQYVVVHS